MLSHLLKYIRRDDKCDTTHHYYDDQITPGGYVVCISDNYNYIDNYIDAYQFEALVTICFEKYEIWLYIIYYYNRK